jgi:hypothetical protein
MQHLQSIRDGQKHFAQVQGRKYWYWVSYRTIIGVGGGGLMQNVKTDRKYSVTTSRHKGRVNGTYIDAGEFKTFLDACLKEDGISYEDVVYSANTGSNATPWL